MEHKTWAWKTKALADVILGCLWSTAVAEVVAVAVAVAATLGEQAAVV